MRQFVSDYGCYTPSLPRYGTRYDIDEKFCRLRDNFGGSVAISIVRGGCGRENSDVLEGMRMLISHLFGQIATSKTTHFLLWIIHRVQKGFSNHTWPILLCKDRLLPLIGTCIILAKSEKIRRGGCRVKIQGQKGSLASLKRFWCLILYPS